MVGVIYLQKCSIQNNILSEPGYWKNVSFCLSWWPTFFWRFVLDFVARYLYLSRQIEKYHSTSLSLNKWTWIQFFFSSFHVLISSDFWNSQYNDFLLKNIYHNGKIIGAFIFGFRVQTRLSFYGPQWQFHRTVCISPRILFSDGSVGYPILPGCSN